MAIYKEGQIVTPQQNSRERAASSGTYGLYADEGVVTTSANLTVAVAAITGGSYVINDTVETTAYAGGTVTSDAADGTNPRIDVVIVNQSGTVSITKGTAAADPEAPDIGAGDLALAELYLAASDTAYASSDIFDMREVIGQRKGRKSSDVVAASTPVVLVDEFCDITGTTTITGLPARVAGWEVELYFDSALQITHHATSMVLVGAVNRSVAAGETARFRCLDGTNWKETVRPDAQSDFYTQYKRTISVPERRLVGLVVAGEGTYVNGDTFGLGARFQRQNSGTLAYSSGGMLPSSSANASGIAGLALPPVAPQDNPRMLVSMRWSAGVAATLYEVVGFAASIIAANGVGAFLRILTTGNLFFVTDSGGGETTTDLGAAPTTGETVYEIYTADAGVTWKCDNFLTSTNLASHTTDLPSASAVKTPVASVANNTTTDAPGPIIREMLVVADASELEA